jgi:hypothetical protein
VGIRWEFGFTSGRHGLYLIEIIIYAGLAQWQCSGFVNRQRNGGMQRNPLGFLAENRGNREQNRVYRRHTTRHTAASPSPVSRGRRWPAPNITRRAKITGIEGRYNLDPASSVMPEIIAADNGDGMPIKCLGTMPFERGA